jgi:hypothetical protein
MPGSVESVGAMRLSPYAFKSESAIDGDMSVTNMMGESAGFTLR